MVASSIVKRTRSIDELRERMDPEHMQIIMESSFLHEFFPEDLARRTNNEQLGPSNGQAFVLYHYNGLPRSNKDKRVRYASARAVISDYGYGNDIPSSAVQPVQAGEQHTSTQRADKQTNIHCLFRKLPADHGCLENEMGDH